VRHRCVSRPRSPHWAGDTVDGHRGRSTASGLLGVLLGVALTAGAGVALAQPSAPGRQFVVPAAGSVPVLGEGAPAATARLRPEEPRPGHRPARSLPPGPGSATNPSTARPTRLVIPSVHLDAPVVGVDVAGGALAVPEDVHTLGWWSTGPSPGAVSGTSVLDGHVDSARQGLGALAVVAHVNLGDIMIVHSVQGEHRYVIVAQRTYHKDALPSNIFATTGRPRLALITCGGPFDSATHHYNDNIVTYAVPTT